MSENHALAGSLIVIVVVELEVLLDILVDLAILLLRGRHWSTSLFLCSRWCCLLVQHYLVPNLLVLLDCIFPLRDLGLRLWLLLRLLG